MRTANARSLRQSPRLHRLLAGLTAGLVLAVGAAGAATFDDPPEHTRDGTLVLSWEADQTVELELASTPDYADARILYAGGDRSSVVTGLADGEYRFRLRPEGADTWTDTARVTVEHHSLSRAFGFFAVGGLVFLALIAAILRGRVRD